MIPTMTDKLKHSWKLQRIHSFCSAGVVCTSKTSIVLLKLQCFDKQNFHCANFGESRAKCHSNENTLIFCVFIWMAHRPTFSTYFFLNETSIGKT